MKKIPNALRKACNRCMALIPSIPSGKLLYCILGLLLAAFFNIVLGMAACVVPAAFGGFIAMFAGLWSDGPGKADWSGWLSSVIGGGLIQIFVLL